MALQPIPESSIPILNSDPSDFVRQGSEPGPSSLTQHEPSSPKSPKTRKISGPSATTGRKLSAGSGKGIAAVTGTRFPSGRWRSKKVSLTNLKQDKDAIQDIVHHQQSRESRDELVETEDVKREKDKLEEDHYSWVEKHITYRTCSHFVPDPKDSNLCQCKRTRQGHNDSAPFSEDPLPEGHQWTKSDHTKEVTTDTFGHLEFVDKPGDKPKTSRYIRVSPKTSADDLYHIFTEHWQVPEPNIIISVTGGAQDFNLDPELSRLFKKGLVNAAKNTGAWITTGGTNHGVMSYVGDAIAEQPITVRNGLAVIGFVSWGVMYGRDKLIFRKKQKPKMANLTLDPGKQPQYNRKPSGGASFKWLALMSAGGDAGGVVNTHKQDKKDKMRAHMVRKRVKKYSMKKELGSRDILLNPNHSHFVFVDDGTIGRFGVEIDLRSQFEECVSRRAGKPKDPSSAKAKTAPGGAVAVDRSTTTSMMRRSSLQLNASCKVVCVLLEGGPNSLETVCKSLDVGTPAVIAKDSGRAADIIAFAKENCLSQSGTDSSQAEFSEKTINQLKRDMTKMFTLKKSEREAKLQTQIQYLKRICSKQNDNLVTIYSIRDPHNNDLDKALLGAIMKAMQDKPEASRDELASQLIFAVRWNRPDTAAKYIFDKNRQEEWPPGFLRDIFLECCLDNKHEFVRLLLNNGVSLHDFKYVYHLEQLFSVLNTKSDLMYSFLGSIRGGYRFENKYLAGVEKGVRSLIGKGFRMSFLTQEFLDKYEKFSTNRKKEEERKMELEKKPVELTNDELQDLTPPEVPDPSILFFIWAVIMNYHKMAKHFWEHGDNYLAKALIGMRLYKSMVENLDVGNKEEDMLANAEDFGQIAMDLLQQCHEDDDKELRQMLIAQNSLCKTHSVLGLAELADHEDFIAHIDPQRILNEIWSGAIKQEEWMLFKVCLGLLCPLVIPWILDYDRVGNVFDTTQEEYQEMLTRNESLLSVETDVDEETGKGEAGVKNTGQEEVGFTDIVDMVDDSFASDDSSKRSRNSKAMRKQKTYDNAMRVTDQNYEYSDADKEVLPEVSIFRRFIYFYKAPVTKFYCNQFIYLVFLLTFTFMVLSELPEDVHWLELLLASIVLSISTEELRQLVMQGGRISRKLKDHMSSVWNWMDLTGIFFFWLPFFLRFAPLTHSGDVARLFYIFDLFFWYMRILNIFTVSKRLGPVVTIILNMIPNLVRFSFVWIVFMAAFGVISKANSTPQRFGDVTPYDVLNVISFSYWQTYGELFLDDLAHDAKLEPDITCTEHYEDNSGLPPCPFLPRFSVYFLAVYMLIGNVLLMNLLIAMFSSVYEEVNSRSLTDWKNKRMALIVEYHTRPFLPLPLTLIQHVYILFTWKRHAPKARLAIGLTVKQSEDRLRQLESFEEESKEEYLVNQSNKQALDVSKQVWALEKKVEEASSQIQEMKQNLEKQARDQTESLNNISKAVNNLTELLKAATSKKGDSK